MKKKIFSFIVLALCSASVWADVVINSTNFPDAIFRSYVTSKVAGGSDGKLTSTEISKVTTINVNGLGVSNLQGIEFFTSLKRLGCANNNLTALDISANTKLTYLQCSQNQLTDLNVSKNTLLDTLICNHNKLSSIELKNMPNLVYCRVQNNLLSAIDLSNNPKLTHLHCGWNNIKSLNIENNLELRQLVCYYNSLEELDLSHNTKISDLQIQGNFLKTIDLSYMPALEHLTCSRNNLTELDLSKNKNLNHIGCAENHILQLRQPAGATFTDWKGDTNVSATNFSANQNVTLLAEPMNVNGEEKYVITMPEDFVDNSSLTYDVEHIKKVNNLNGKNGTFFIIAPNFRPDSFIYMYNFNDTGTNFSVVVNVNYQKLYCDVNEDGVVDVADMNEVINEILGSH